VKTLRWIALLALCIGLSLFVEWHTDEVTIVLAVMSLLAVVLGASYPRLAWLGGPALGFSILVAHAITDALGLYRPPYMHGPSTKGDWAAMAIAGLWITALTCLSGYARSKLERGTEPFGSA
jgi:ABC-type amino acid transport substrate-binding protein